MDKNNLMDAKHFLLVQLGEVGKYSSLTLHISSQFTWMNWKKRLLIVKLKHEINWENMTFKLLKRFWLVNWISTFHGGFMVLRCYDSNVHPIA
jgi:hypothetical protein